MADFRRLLYAFAIVAFLATLTIPANAQFVCNSFNGVNTALRAEGFTELAGDITFNCSGGTPTTPGAPVPTANIVVSSNTNITSRILASTPVNGITTQYNEALMLMDEPNTIAWNNVGGHPLHNCGATGEDSNGSFGPGVCQIIASGLGPAHTYDGISGLQGAPGVGLPDVACTASTFGCGRPNVFQGRNAASLISGQFNAIQFLAIPFDPPGTTFSRTIRITNIRVDATRFGVASPFSTVPVTATVSFSNSTTVSVPDTTITIGQVQQGMTTTVFGATNFLQCVGTDIDTGSAKTPFFPGTGAASPTGTPSPTTLLGFPHTMDIRVQENFATAWKVRNISQILLNSTAGSIATGTYTCGVCTIPPPAGIWTATDDVQNVPGAVYNSESGFENTGAIPAPNPPTGLGNGTPTGAPNLAFTDATTGIANAGKATQGTRIAIQVSAPLPTGARLFFPISVLLQNQSNAAVTGIMQVNALADQTGFTSGTPAPFLAASPTIFQFTPSGGGPATTVTNTTWVEVTAAFPIITYEILFDQPGSLEYADIVPAIVFNNNGLSSTPPTPQTGLAITASASFAPIQSGIPNANRPQQDGLYATPRFTNSFKTPGDTLAQITQCACDLLFPWVVSSGSIDTGIVVANTSLDPCAGSGTCTLGFLATPQSGTVTFYYFGTVGIGDQNAAASLTPNTSKSVPAGGYVAHVLSQNTTASNGLGSRTNFAGYVIAQANFEFCHGVADITNGATPIFNYVGLVLDKGLQLPRTTQAATDSLAH